ncbi:exocyst complex component 3 [Cloeon dipterum]|uniref:exocyst complex component 3 n=1 Tax=Cloeon dipterum TaxID=197152 RepID=UPI00321F643B
MDFDNLEIKAKEDAKKRVQQLLQRVDQLEKVDQYKRRVERKKASVESMLKTAMQSQLDGVRVGLNQLQVSLKDVQEIKENLKSLEDFFGVVPELSNKLQEVREENMRHSQYVTAMENLKHIFTVPESVERTKQWINEGKLLHAHQSLADLENSRDDLLFELHKLPNQDPLDTRMLKEYFDEVNNLSIYFSKQIKLIIGRTLNTVRKEPTVIVTALRIIEREEKADAEAQERFGRSGFMPPGRPKNWKKMAMDVLDDGVAQRVEGTQTNDRSEDKMWLVKHFELNRMLISEDLQVVKDLCVPCFPPHYNILNVFVEMYHNALSRHLMNISRNGLVGNEYITFLNWVLHTYNGPELMMNPELNINTSSLKPLLTSEEVTDLENQYLKILEANFIEWMNRTLETEKQEWQKISPPETNDDQYFITHAPLIISSMVTENLKLAHSTSQQLTFKAVQLSIMQVTRFGNIYRDAIILFKTSHFEDRKQNPYFTNHMIKIVNNCLAFEEMANQIKLEHWKPGIHDMMAAQSFETLRITFQNLRRESARYLLEEAFLDLEPHFQECVTAKWIGNSSAVETIRVTLEDYISDYRHLKPENFEIAITECMNTVAKKYITSMLLKKMTFKTSDDRKEGANQIKNEAEILQKFFMRTAPEIASENECIEAIKQLADVLENEDSEMLSLDLHALVEKYPDVTEEHLIQLLLLRGDVSKSEAREMATFALSSRKEKDGKHSKTIFSLVKGIQVSYFL